MSHGLCVPGWAAARTRAVPAECPVPAACKAAIACVHTHAIHTGPAVSVSTSSWLLSCSKQLLTAAEEGFSVAMFLIENADSN